MTMTVSSRRGPVVVSVCFASHALPEVAFESVIRAALSPDELCSPAKVWIESADALFRSGFCHTSAVVARIALEKMAIATTKAAGEKPRRFGKMVQVLADRGIITKDRRAQLIRLYGFASHCSHGGAGRIEQILELLAGVRALEASLPR